MSSNLPKPLSPFSLKLVPSDLCPNIRINHGLVSFFFLFRVSRTADAASRPTGAHARPAAVAAARSAGRSLFFSLPLSLSFFFPLPFSLSFFFSFSFPLPLFHSSLSPAAHPRTPLGSPPARARASPWPCTPPPAAPPYSTHARAHPTTPRTARTCPARAPRRASLGRAHARAHALAARGAPRHTTAACHALHAFHAVPKPAAPPAVSTITAFLCPPSPSAMHTRAQLAQRCRLAARAAQRDAKLSSRSFHVLVLPSALTLPEPSRRRRESRAALLRDTEHH